MNFPRELHNSLYRVVTIYVLSLFIEGVLGMGTGYPTDAWKIDMLHDIVSLMIYRKFAQYVIPQLLLEDDTKKIFSELSETVILTVLGFYFAGKQLNYGLLASLFIIVWVYHYMIRPHLKKLAVYNEGIEDMAQTLVLLSATDLTVKGITSKMLALLIHHNFLKL